MGKARIEQEGGQQNVYYFFMNTLFDGIAGFPVAGEKGDQSGSFFVSSITWPASVPLKD